MSLPIDHLAAALRKNGVSRFMERVATRFADCHLKDLTVDELGPGRRMVVNGRTVVNFGSDSFLGLDQDPRVQEAIVRGTATWGTHNGASRMFASVRANVEAEEKIARWLGTEAALIYPSVTLANLGAIPALATRADFIACDAYAHNSMQEGIKIARANGVRSATFAHNDPADLERVLQEARPYRFAVVAIDGVYSMTGEVPPFRLFDAACRRHDGVLYVDDAHGTGVLGGAGRGTVLDGLGSYDNTLVVGSLSKAFSAAGGFIGCPESLLRTLKTRSNSYIFGGPVPPPYLEAVCTVIDIIQSPEYDAIRGRLEANLRRLADGLARHGFVVLGGRTPIVSVRTGEEEVTYRAGKFLFDRGYYVQSVTFPAVPHRAGVLRVQVNANHEPAQIDGLLAAAGELKRALPIPTAEGREAA
jgi:7-keto-8-aminopelargonate synthetase-like enzyme